MDGAGQKRDGSLGDWLVVLLLTGVSIFAFLDRFALSLLLDPIKHALKINDAELGLLNGVGFGLFYAALGLPLGWLADRWSRKGTILIGVTIWSIATACCGLAMTFGQLLAARIGVGAGEAGLVPSSYAIIHDRFARGRLSLATAVFQIGGFLGAGLCMLTTGYVYAFFAHGGGSSIPFISGLQPWQQTFIVAAVPGIFFFGMLLLLRESRHPSAGVDGRQTSALGRSRAPPTILYALLFFGMGAEIACTYALQSWLPAILAREAHWAPQKIGLFYGSILLVVAPAGILMGGWLADTLHERGRADSHVIVPFFSACVLLPLLLLIPIASAGVHLLILAACLHFVLCLPMGVVPALIQQITPLQRRSRTSAVYVLICNVLGLGLIPVSIGFISSLTPGLPEALRMALFYTTLPADLVALMLLFRLRSVFVTWRSAPADAAPPPHEASLGRHAQPQ